MNFNSIFSQIGVPASMAQDVMFLLVIALVSFIFGMLIGKHRLITVLINIYASFAILKVVPGGYLTTYSAVLLFFFAVLVALTILGKSLFEISISGSGSGFLWRVFMVSFLEVALLASITLSIMPKKEALLYVSKTVYGYMVLPNAQFLWMVAPLAALFIIHKRLGR